MHCTVRGEYGDQLRVSSTLQVTHNLRIRPCASQLCSFRIAVSTRISSAPYAIHCELQLLCTVYTHSPTFPHYQIAPLIRRHMCLSTVAMNISKMNLAACIHKHQSPWLHISRTCAHVLLLWCVCTTDRPWRSTYITHLPP